MTQKDKKRSAAIDSHIQGGNLENLILEILKFRDRLQGRQTNQISQDRLMICAGDWAQFHDPKNLDGYLV